MSQFKIPEHPHSNFNELYFGILLEESISLSLEEKERVIVAIPRLSQSQMDELFEIFEGERTKFRELGTEFGTDEKTLRSIKAEGLKKSTRIEIQSFLNPHNQNIIRELTRHPDEVHSLSPRQFEILIAEILADQGWEVELTPETRDGGRDLIATIPFMGTRLLSIIECKKWRHDRPVGLDVIERFVYTLREKDKANLGMIATTSYFSPDATNVANDFEWLIKLNDYNMIKDMMQSFGNLKKACGTGIWHPYGAEQDGADQPATAPESKSESNEKT